MQQRSQILIKQILLTIADSVLLVACSYYASTIIAKALEETLSFGFLPWSDRWVFHEKPFELIYYIACTGMLSVYFTFCLASQKIGWLLQKILSIILNVYKMAEISKLGKIAICISALVIILTLFVIQRAFTNPVILNENFEIPSYKKLSEEERTALPEKIRPALTQDGYINTLTLENSCLHIDIASTPEEAVAVRYEDAFRSYRTIQEMLKFRKLYSTNKWLRKYIFHERQNELQVLYRTYSNTHNQYFYPVNYTKVTGGSLFAGGNLYGVILPTLTNWYLNQTGDNYFNFLRFCYILYLAYIATATLFLWCFYRNTSKVIIGTAFVSLLTIFFAFRGYEYLIAAQYTVNPVRHGLDFLAFSLMYHYFSSGKKISQVAFYVLGSIAIFLGTHFGIFLLISGFLANLVYAGGCKSFRREAFTASVLFLLALLVHLAFIEPHQNGNPGLIYFASGFFSFSSFAKEKLIIFLYILSFTFFLFIVRTEKVLTPRLLVLFMILMYYVFMLFHFIWHGLEANMNPSLPILGLLLFMSCEQLSRLYEHKQKLYHFTAISLLVILFFAKVPQYIVGAYAYENEFRSYKSFNGIPGYRLPVTYDDSYISDSISLIHKYSTNSSIFMISKYDFFLFPLSRRVSSSGFPSLIDFVVTDSELQTVKSQLLKTPPSFLFVDNDIDMGVLLGRFNSAVTLSKPDYFYETQFLITRMLMLRDIFDSVRSKYKPIERGKLLTVYIRREGE